MSKAPEYQPLLQYKAWQIWILFQNLFGKRCAVGDSSYFIVRESTQLRMTGNKKEAQNPGEQSPTACNMDSLAENLCTSM